ncbi:FAD dependent oxidoreductase TIGR03364 [Gordonia malaquae]|uniref:Putative oxidoreductase n=1 Tax=Gordonia malaquae NBRC 108250 TaxID=1223542 RepID=M3V9V2_GORML|nr:TIGR03364 family FAD-dependent oxidoreductase [Gordonia malaquae]GAC78273.1 putative oxidoreductase [Gordonia malaquae NBRC 108250]SED28298.1 FAD dependent oxidoreductase TIGR03364 [Gordonia malaquae]
MSHNECDVLVVGAGIVGLGHALAAADAGNSVIVIDRDRRPVGASVRNFGHICVTGQTGELRDLAVGSRERWLNLATRAGVAVRTQAGLGVARAADEMAVLDELASTRDSVSPIDANTTREALGGAGADDVVGGALLLDDLRVDPRTTAPAVAAWLSARDDVEFRWNTSYLGVDDATDGDVRIRTSRGQIRAARVFVCVGHDLDYTAPVVAEEHDVHRCGLSMLQVADPGFRVNSAVLTATSFLRYGAFAETTAVRALATRIDDDRPDLRAADTNIMFTQRPDGSLLIGDSHHLDRTLDPFLDERVADLIVHEVETILGTDLTVIGRWQGVYASRPGGPYLTAELAPGVRACSVTTGVGMTVGLELAARHVAGELV